MRWVFVTPHDHSCVLPSQTEGLTGSQSRVCTSPITLRASLLTTPDSELGLADVLVDDVTDAELLLLPQPHQLHTLMDEDVLLLGESTEAEGGVWEEEAPIPGSTIIRTWCKRKSLSCLYSNNFIT